ncbi:MAG: hypothetical protein ACKO0M_01605 [Cyanobium sp.]
MANHPVHHPHRRRSRESGQPSARRGGSLGPRRRAGRASLLASPLRPGQGSALVQALIVVSVAVIAGLALASKLSSSRYGSITASDTLAAREAAEYGLNEIQAQLNTNPYGYLWVTNWNKWTATGANQLTSTSLSDCNLSALDSNQAIITPAVPAGVTSAKTIRNSNGATVTYQVTNFTPPALPDSSSTTAAQSGYCSSAAAAANFGNLNGGAAVIEVRGTVDRGSGTVASFRLRRTTHVLPPLGIRPLGYSLLILGDANTTDNGSTNSNISEITYFDGNICYVQPDGSIPSNCITANPTPVLATIGCYNLRSCLINNQLIGSNQLGKYCTALNSGGLKKQGLTCNNYQQAALPFPDPPTPTTEGFLTTGSTAFNSATTADWTTYSRSLSCDLDTSICTTGTSSANKNAFTTAFPFVTPNTTTPPPSAIVTGTTFLRQRDLIEGCYFNNAAANNANNSATSTTTTINCLFNDITITGKSATRRDLIFYTTTSTTAGTPTIKAGNGTSPIKINVFLYTAGTSTNSICLGQSTTCAGKNGKGGGQADGGGISNSDASLTAWTRLRIFGKKNASYTPYTVPPSTVTSPVSCSTSQGITSTTGDDITGAFLWLPNAELTYSGIASNTVTYSVFWVCKFKGPSSGTGGGNKYSLITPSSEIVRQNLNTSGIPGLGTLSLGSDLTYRGYGSEDAPL